MYSRYHNRDDRPLSIPENYSGCAFSNTGEQSAKTERSAAPPHRIEIAKPTPPEAPLVPMPPGAVLLPPPERRDNHPPIGDERAAEHQAPAPRQEEEDSPTQTPPALALPAPLRDLFGRMGSAFPFSHGIGFDELLLLGLILLLARNESDSDLILWLVLLLFCG